jgi:nucleotide-binding universal stress UspA family protein
VYKHLLLPTDGSSIAASGVREGVKLAEYRRLTEAMARKALDTVVRAARAAGVSCRTRLMTDAQPWNGILRAARAWRCDAIVMGSHGRGAVGGLILGAETSRVLAHAKLPVLVVRGRERR